MRRVMREQAWAEPLRPHLSIALNSCQNQVQQKSFPHVGEDFHNAVSAPGEYPVQTADRAT